MKRIISSISIFTIACLSFTACNDQDKEPTPSGPEKGSLVISIDNQVDGQELEPGEMKYTNAAGNLYSVDLLRYYMSHFILVREDNSADTFVQFQLIDESKPGQNTFTIPELNDGKYKALKFYVGVGPDRNHSGAQDGFLNPAYGMLWMWHTGYTFLKLEGKFKNSANTISQLRHHLGQDEALPLVEIPLNDLVIAGNERKLKLALNVNSIYAPPAKIDFNLDPSHESDTESDKAWMASMKANISHGAFSLLEVE